MKQRDYSQCLVDDAISNKAWCTSMRLASQLHQGPIVDGPSQSFKKTPAISKLGMPNGPLREISGFPSRSAGACFRLARGSFLQWISKMQIVIEEMDVHVSKVFSALFSIFQFHRELSSVIGSSMIASRSPRTKMNFRTQCLMQDKL